MQKGVSVKPREQETKNEIRNLLLVIGGGVFSAFVIAAYFVMNYGPTGQYEATTALLGPELLSQLNYNDNNSKTGGVDRFVFDRIEFSYFDASRRKWIQIPINEDQYVEFYQMIASDKSILDPNGQMEVLFFKDSPSKLSLIVKTESPAAWQALAKIFQEVQFVEDYYRVRLHEQAPGEHWVYFHHLKIAEKTAQLFTR